MACSLARSVQLIPLVNQFQCVVQMECFTSSEKLRDAITCSQACASRAQRSREGYTEYCLVHPKKKRDLFCEHCTEEICKECVSIDHINHQCAESSTVICEERRRVSETLNNVMELLEEMKQKISGVKEMKQRVRNRENDNVTATREVFATLRKVINDREEVVITSIKEAAVKRQKALEVNKSCSVFVMLLSY